MEITEARLRQMVSEQVASVMQDKHPGTMPKELTEFKSAISVFAKQITKDKAVNYDSVSQGINSLLRAKFDLHRINDLPLSKITEAYQILEEVKAMF